MVNSKSTVVLSCENYVHIDNRDDGGGIGGGCSGCGGGGGL